MSEKKPKVILVLSMHRSGSSLLTQLLGIAGVNLGNQLLEGREDNPGGFWEHGPLVNLHTRMLEALGGNWYLPGEIRDLSGLLASFGAEAARLVEEMDAVGITWAWKDPRMPLFLEFWMEVLRHREVYVLIANRQPEAVIQSLHKRDGLPEVLSRALWVYHFSMIPGILPRVKKRMVIDYEQLIGNPTETIEQLMGFLDGLLALKPGEDVRSKMVAVIRPGWSHFVASPGGQTVDDTPARLLKMLYGDLSPQLEAERQAIQQEALRSIQAYSAGGFALKPEQEKTRVYFKSNPADSVFSFFKTFSGLSDRLVLAFDHPLSVCDFKVVFNRYIIVEGVSARFFFEEKELPVSVEVLSNAWEYQDGIWYFDTETPYFHIRMGSELSWEVDAVQIELRLRATGFDAYRVLHQRLKTQFLELNEYLRKKELGYKALELGYKELEAKYQSLESAYRYLQSEYNTTWRLLLQIRRIAFRKIRRIGRKVADWVLGRAADKALGSRSAGVRFKAWLERLGDLARMYWLDTRSFILSGKRTRYVPFKSYPAIEPSCKILAFYLPQFHPIPENDTWWGEGFTEWTNVRPAQPQFEGHYQPRVPDTLGYYNLLDPGVQKQQVALAKNYGLGGFCFHFYWFNGVRLLEQPILNYLADKDLDLPFCLSWANESWSRRWDGKEQEVLMQQAHSPEDDIAFIAYVATYFSDPRYIRIKDKPLLLVYRPGILPNAKETTDRWRDWCRANGVGELYLACSQSFEKEDPTLYGMDAALEFPPNNMGVDRVKMAVRPTIPDFDMQLYGWRFLWRRSWNRPSPSYPLFWGVCPSWDNTARRKNKGTALLDAHPVLYQGWLMNAIRDTIRRFSHPDERLIFINAWNEWAEGAYLEPDKRYGYAYLEATRKALLDVRRFRFGRVLPDISFRSNRIKTFFSTKGLASSKKVENPSFEGNKLVLVGHDALLFGAQFIALEMLRVLTQDLTVEVEVLLLKGGELLPEYEQLARVHVLSPASDSKTQVEDLARRLARRGYRKAIINTTVSGWVIPYFKKEGMECVALIHELPQLIQHYGLSKEVASIMAYADKIVFPHIAVQQGFSTFGNLTDAKALIRPQGMYKRNRWRYFRQDARSKLRAELGVSADSFIVLAVGYGDHRKGIDLFVQIAQVLLVRHPSVVFVWVGAIHPQMVGLQDTLAEKFPASSRLIWAGQKADTGYYFAGSDVLALTSREDPFPSVVMEAYDAGIPVVAFEGTGGFATLLAEEGIGVVVPAFDILAFASAVEALMVDERHRLYLGDSGQRYVDEVLSYRKYVFFLSEQLGIELPKVSVVVPNFNYARHMKHRLDSIRQQRFPIYELIILDDASGDHSKEEIIAWMAASRMECRLVFSSMNSGSVLAQWEKGVELATGDFIWIAEADDLCEPDFLQTVYYPMKADTQVVLSYCDSTQINEQGHFLDSSYQVYLQDVSHTRWKQDFVREGKDEIRESLAVLNTIPNVSAVLFRRAALQAVLTEKMEQLRPLKRAFDYLLYVYVLEQGRIAYANNPANHHRRHSQSVISRSDNLALYQEIAAVQQIVAQQFVPPEEALDAAAAYRFKLQKQFNLPASIG